LLVPITIGLASLASCHGRLSWPKNKVFLNIKIIICILHISICALLDSGHGAKGGGQGVYFKKKKLLCQEIVISYSMMTNLSMDIWAPFVVHHEWYGCDPKTNKKRKELEYQKTVKNVSMHHENDRKDQKKKVSILGIFNILQYYFQCPQLSWCCLGCLPSLPNTNFVDIVVLHSLWA